MRRFIIVSKMPARMTLPAVMIPLAFAVTACAPQSPKEDFSALAEEFVYTSLANSPVAATQVGFHRHGNLELDSMLDDFSPTVDRTAAAVASAVATSAASRS